MARDLRRLPGERAGAGAAGHAGAIARPSSSARHRMAAAQALALAVVVIGAAWALLAQRAPGCRCDRSRRGAASAVLPPLPQDKSVAVLPFADLSEQRDQEHFSDGLAEELIDRLAHSRNLRVIARTSAFAFKGQPDDVRTVASHASAWRTCCRAACARAARCCASTHGWCGRWMAHPLWSQTYERDMADLFKVQDDIASSVATALEAVLTDRPMHRGVRVPDIEAYNLVLQGDVYTHGPFERDAQRAEVAYKQAIELDPAYALPWAKLAAAVLAPGRTVARTEGAGARQRAPRHRCRAAHRPQLDGRARGALSLPGAGRRPVARGARHARPHARDRSERRVPAAGVRGPLRQRDRPPRRSDQDPARHRRARSAECRRGRHAGVVPAGGRPLRRVAGVASARAADEPARDRQPRADRRQPRAAAAQRRGAGGDRAGAPQGLPAVGAVARAHAARRARRSRCGAGRAEGRARRQRLLDRAPVCRARQQGGRLRVAEQGVQRSASTAATC